MPVLANVDIVTFHALQDSLRYNEYVYNAKTAFCKYMLYLSGALVSDLTIIIIIIRFE